MESGKCQDLPKYLANDPARRADVKDPAVELPYFDTVSQSYQLARSQPIPLTVKLTKVVKAEMRRSDALWFCRQVESRIHGIAHNYEGGT